GGSSTLPLIRELLDVTTNTPLAAFETRVTNDGMYGTCGDEDGALGPVDVENWEIWDEEPGVVGRSYYARSRYRESPALEVLQGSYVSDSGLDVGSIVASAKDWAYFDKHWTNRLYATNDWSTQPPYPVVTPPVWGDTLRTWGEMFAWHD